MEKTEGITLKITPFNERDRIIVLFTKDMGIISLLAKEKAPIDIVFYP